MKGKERAAEQERGGASEELSGDEELMLRYQRGEAEAMEQLIKRYHRPLYGFLRRSLPSREAAEDAFQEVFLKVVRAAPEYRSSSRFAAWLYTIARNVVIDMVRRDKNQATESLDAPAFEEGASRGDQTATEDPDPEANLAGRELAEILEEAIAALPAEQREVFLLRERAGLSFQEIAEITRAPLNTVKTRMHYALNRLRKTLVREGLLEEER